MKRMRILFIGCVEASYTELKLLIDNGKNIAGVITKENSEVNSDFCDLSPLCKDKGIPFIYTKDINDKITIDFIKRCKPDIGYCFGWSQIICSSVLEIPSKGIIGNHPAELPYNKGRHPIIWALALGLDRTASTFFVMNETADSGNIISQEIIPIKTTDYARDLYNRISESECRQILRFTEEMEHGILKFIQQDTNVGNFWRKRTQRDGIIDWRMSGKAIYNLIRALSEPYIGAGFLYQDKEIKIWRAEILSGDEYGNIEPGKVVRVNSTTDYVVKAYDCLIHVVKSDEFCGKEGEYL